MRAILISLLIILLAPATWAQDDEPEIFTIVEVMPQFKGGEKALLQYLKKNIKYPKEARDAGIQGIVYVKFRVDNEGKIKDARILRGIGGGCDEEALRVVNNMPDWDPGTQREIPVNVYYNLPIRYTLPEPKPRKK